MVGYVVGLKAAFFHLTYQGNWIYKKGLVLLFYMRYSRLLSGKKIARWQLQMLRVGLALLRKTIGKQHCTYASARAGVPSTDDGIFL